MKRVLERLRPRRSPTADGSAPETTGPSPIPAPLLADRPDPDRNVAVGDQDAPTASSLDAASRQALFAEVDALADEFRNSGDPDVAVRLTDKRFEAAAGYDGPVARADWPPAYDDPFPDQEPGTLPEVDIADIDAATVAGAIAHHGSCIVRGLFSAERVERTIDAIHEVEARRDAPDDERTPDAWYRPYLDLDPFPLALRDMVTQHGGTWLADSPIASAQVIDDLRDSGAIGLVTAHFGERPFFSLQKSTLRRSPPVHDFAGWHQDGSFLGPEVRTLNVWIALSDCGGDRPTPGLELVPRRVEFLLDRDGGLGSASISDATVHAAAGDTPAIVPTFDAGDALIFDQQLVHRTHLFSGMTYDRYALECWLFAPSNAAVEYVPLLV